MTSQRLRNVVGLLILTTAISSFADNVNDPPEAQEQYAAGKQLLRDGDFRGAQKIFDELTEKYPVSDHLDLYIFHRAKAKYYLGDYDYAITSISYLVDRFPKSRLLPHAVFLLGNAYYLDGKINAALKSYFESYRISNDKRLDQVLLSSVEAAVANASKVSLAISDLKTIPANKKCYLAQAVAKGLLTRGDSLQAINIYKACSQEEGSNQLDPDNRSRKGDVKIAVALPLSGELQQYGEEIYNGAVIAARDFNAATGRNIELTPYDTKADAVDAARIISELSRDNSVIAAVGPLTSEEAAVASASLVCGDLPMIVPAATQAGLTGLSNTSFQLSPNIELEGVVMADYAVRNLGADTAAVITSTAADYLRMTGAFTRRFKELGGTIIAVEYYRPRDRDFGPQVKDIKRELLGALPDSVNFISPGGDTLEIDAVPAHLDCLYLPGDAEQIKLLVPQVNFYSLNAVFLGSDGWADDRIYRLGDNVTKSSVFPSQFLEKESSEISLKFNAAYDIRYGKRPERLAALGYDAVKLIADAYISGGSSRDKLVKKLAELKKFQGASGRITFGQHRENVEMPIYRIDKGRPVLVVGQNPTAELIDSNR